MPESSLFFTPIIWWWSHSCSSLYAIYLFCLRIWQLAMLISSRIFIRGKQGEKLSSLTYLFYLFAFLFNNILSLNFWYFTEIPCGQIVWYGCEREIFKKWKKKKDCHKKQGVVQRKEPRSFILSHSTGAKILHRSDTYTHRHTRLHHLWWNITVSGKASGYQVVTTDSRRGKVRSEGQKAFLPREHHRIADILPGKTHEDAAWENHPSSERPKIKLSCAWEGESDSDLLKIAPCVPSPRTN